MTELIKETIAPFVGVAVYLLLSRIERRAYEQGYKDAMYDRCPRFRRPIGFNQNKTDGKETE